MQVGSARGDGVATRLAGGIEPHALVSRTSPATVRPERTRPGECRLRSALANTAGERPERNSGQYPSLTVQREPMAGLLVVIHCITLGRATSLRCHAAPGHDDIRMAARKRFICGVKDTNGKTYVIGRTLFETRNCFKRHLKWDATRVQAKPVEFAQGQSLVAQTSHALRGLPATVGQLAARNFSC